MVMKRIINFACYLIADVILALILCSLVYCLWDLVRVYL